MRLSLMPHPDTPAAIAAITVEVERPHPAALTLHYRVNGGAALLRLQPTVAAEHTDGLWQNTCFEVFVRGNHQTAYREFNFAPSTAWAAYSFDSYREGMRNLETPPPHIHARPEGDDFLLTASIELAPPLPWRIALSAVIEELSGQKSYWALAHPPGRPDFHNAIGFDHKLT